MSRELAGYARSGAWSIVAHATQLAGALILSIVVARTLDVEELGRLSIGRTLAATAVLLSGFALERVILRFIPELVETHGARAANRFFWKTLTLRVVAWVPLMVFTWFFADLFDRLFHGPMAQTARVAVATGVLFGVYNHVRAGATAHFETAAVARATAVSSVLVLAATVVALQRGHGIDAILWIAGFGMFVAALLMLPAAIGRVGGDAVVPSARGEFSLRDKRFLDYAVPFGGIAVLNYVVHSQTEVYFLGHFHGPDLSGFFFYGFTFAQRFIDFLPLALWEVSMAGFSRIAVKTPELLPGALRAYLTLLYLAMAPLALLGVAFSASAIGLLYTPKLLPAAVVSQAYFVMAAVAAFGAPVGMILYARERVGDALRAYLVFAAVNVGLNLLLIPPLGLWGGILALGAAKIVSVLLMSWLAWREVPQLQVPWAFIGRVFLASLPVLAWLWVDDVWTEPWQIVLGGLGAIAVLVLSFRVLRVVGEREAALILDTRLPLRVPLLRLLGHAGARVEEGAGA